MGLRKLVRNTFGFSRAQSNGFVILLPVISIALFSEPVYRWWVTQRSEDFSKEKTELDSLYSAWQHHQEEQNQIAQEEVAVTYFIFDPNTVSEEELRALGFSKGLTKSLIKYREKGGKFRIKSDVQKLYGMDSAFFQSLVPFISLPVEIAKHDKIPFPAKKKFEPFDLNEADTTQLKSIYGIGSKLALRIVRYRDKLGGFIHKNQLQEVYGLDTTVVNKLSKASFLKEKFNPKKINMNTADEGALASHPYINKKIATAIVAYRFQHGNFQTLEDIKKVKLVDDVWFQKVVPYLTLND